MTPSKPADSAQGLSGAGCDYPLCAAPHPCYGDRDDYCDGATKVMQSITEGPDANCMDACVATVFGLAINEVPHLVDDTWQAQLRAFARGRGYGLVHIDVPNEQVFLDGFSGGLLICSGKSARGRLHAVIYRDGKLWHDPHPASNGIDRVECVDFFYPLHGPRALAAKLDSAAGEAVWRWKPRGATVWIYDPAPDWLAAQDPATIDKERLYASPPPKADAVTERYSDECKRFAAWMAETSGFTGHDEAIAWAAWEARAALQSQREPKS